MKQFLDSHGGITKKEDEENQGVAGWELYESGEIEGSGTTCAGSITCR